METHAPDDRRLARLWRFARWLDEGVRLPGTRVRVGADPLIGLVPWLGDAIGAVLAVWIMVEAARRGTSRATLVRMGWNLAVDAVVGTIPLLGDAFDLAWKANLRNLRLMERHAAHPRSSRRADRRFMLVLCGAIVLLCAILLAGTGILLARLVDLITGQHKIL